jgi:hypothetical protein
VANTENIGHLNNALSPYLYRLNFGWVAKLGKWELDKKLWLKFSGTCTPISGTDLELLASGQASMYHIKIQHKTC